MSLSTRLLPALALMLAPPMAGLLGVGPSAAHAAVAAGTGDPVISTATDATGDVVLDADDGGLTPRERRSIDLREITVTETARGAHRFTVRIKRLAPVSEDWDQMVFVRMRDPGSGAVTVLGFNQRSDGGGYVYDDTTSESCEIRRVVRRPRQQTLSVRVPERCTAPAGSRVRVASATGLLNTDAPTWSRDRMRAPALG